MKSHKNYEIEIKLGVPDPAALRRKLARLGARRLRRVYERNILYDTDRRDLFHRGRLLRLRVEAKAGHGHAPLYHSNRHLRGLLTYKGPAATESRYKVREEVEAPVRDSAAIEPVMHALGLRPWFRYEKFRATYRLSRLRGLNIELDETPVGTFLELEGTPAAIDRAARLLGYSPKDYITASYWDLFIQERRRRGKPARDMLFTRRKK
jgi:adenylate cyclase, class 2